MPHAWEIDVLSDVLLQEKCRRCGLIRWRAPGSPAWWYGDGRSGRWERLDGEPACLEPVSPTDEWALALPGTRCDAAPSYSDVLIK